MPLFHPEVGALDGSSAPDGGDQGWFYFQQIGGTGIAGRFLFVNVGTRAVPDWQPVSGIRNDTGAATVTVKDTSNLVAVYGEGDDAALEVNTGPVGHVGSDVLTGVDDPNTLGLATPAPALYLRYNAGVGELWLKTGGLDTEWTKIATSVAPTTADYLVGTANAGLSAEIVVGTSPGGELGGSWGTPTVDATHSGSSHAGLSGQPGSTDVAVADGGTGASTASAARTNLDVPSNAEAILDALVDAKGDIIAATAADTVARLAVGANDQVLTADSAQSTGLKWAAAGGGTLTIEDEGTPLATAATTLDFVGAGVIASGTGAEKTITIAGGGGGSTSFASIAKWGTD